MHLFMCMFGIINTLELYPQIIHCKNETYMISRKTYSDSRYIESWTTVVRQLSNQYKLINEYNMQTSMSHNLAGLCMGDTILFAGGQYRTFYRGFKQWSGLQYSTVKHISAYELERNTKYINAQNCYEKRRTCLYCEFDGKMSIANYNRKLYFFARANLGAGVRWVQVTTFDNNTWSPYTLINIDTVDKSTSSMYYIHVEKWNNTHYIGLYPSVFQSSAGIFRSYSSNLLDWSSPELIVQQQPKHGRVSMHPIGILHNKLVIFNKDQAFIHSIMISAVDVQHCVNCIFTQLKL